MTGDLGSDGLSRKEADALLRRLSVKAGRRRALRAIQPVLLTAAVVLALAGGTWALLRTFGSGASPELRPAQVGVSPEPPDLDPDERPIVFVREGPDGGIYAIESDGSNLRQVTSDPEDDSPAWSPDGSKIAFARDGIYVMNADGTGVRRITEQLSDHSPAWSPDGARIAFVRADEIFLVPSTGGEANMLTSGPLRASSPTWSPDGFRIAFAGYSVPESGPPTPLRLLVIPAAGGEPVEIGPPNASEPSWSPDGSLIAFAAYEDPFGPASLFVIHPDGSGLREIYTGSGPANATAHPSWSPDGTRIAFMDGERIEELHISVIDADGGDPTQLTSGRADLSPSWGG